jgi:hypothetical protein
MTAVIALLAVFCLIELGLAVRACIAIHRRAGRG